VRSLFGFSGQIALAGQSLLGMGKDNLWILFVVSVSVSADLSVNLHENKKKNSQNSQELTEICSKQCFDSISVNS
jgi:hypothetical protein